MSPNSASIGVDQGSSCEVFVAAKRAKDADAGGGGRAGDGVAGSSWGYMSPRCDGQMPSGEELYVQCQDNSGSSKVRSFVAWRGREVSCVTKSMVASFG